MEDLASWVAFAQLECISLKQKHTLLSKYICPKRILNSKPEKFGITLSNKTFDKHIDQSKLEKTLSWQQANSNHHLIYLDHENYPHRLKQINLPPVLVFGIGNAEILNSNQISIVGSRKATLAGQQTCEQFALELSLSGFTITSGLALGIDSSAHKGALAGQGKTIAVLGSGVNQCYPRTNQALYSMIGQQGLIISEFALDIPPLKHHFPQRNRIISGLSWGTLVVEAAPKSGSLITARYALEQNREVFAIPGSIHNINACGCLDLIQQGAKLVRSIEDIFDEFSEFSGTGLNNSANCAKHESKALSQDQQRILALINDVPLTFDKLMSNGRLTVDQLCSILLDLELDGWIEKLPGNQYLRTTK